MEKSSKIYVAGHRGMVGGAILRQLQAEGYENLVVRDSRTLDLRDSKSVESFFSEERPEYVFLAAAKVGGILANDTRRAEFIYDNLAIQNNLIHQAYVNRVKKLLFLGSSCIYPKMSPQPIKEDYLLTGPLEPTNEPYAIAKIAGLKMCEAYRDQYDFDAISLMPTNLYGPGDNFDLASSHVLPALLRKAYTARQQGLHEIAVWGSGSPKREFLYCEDLAKACVYFMNSYSGKEIVNIGTGEDCSIRELTETIMDVVGFEGQIVFDSSKPDGTPRKLLDVSRAAALGWTYDIPLRKGLELTLDYFLKQQK